MGCTFLRGINLGGWLSQCETRQNDAHFRSFITEADLDTIASWGFDHVRLPVDHCVICNGCHSLDESTVRYIDLCIEWCRHQGLGIILDMHMLPGYNIATPGYNNLFVHDRSQQEAIMIWELLAERYRGINDMLRFELLNEPEWKSSYPVNGVYSKLHKAVREKDPERIIMVGANHYCHVDSLESVDILNDLRTIYTFHYYEPLPFTNQLYARSRQITPRYDEEPVYPGPIPHLYEYLIRNPAQAEEWGRYCWIRNDRKLMERNFRKASDFVQYRNRSLYLGEFGVCYHAEEKRRCAWIQDLLEVAEEYNMPWCCWTYKEMDYGLVDITGKIISESYLNILKSHLC